MYMHESIKLDRLWLYGTIYNTMKYYHITSISAVQYVIPESWVHVLVSSELRNCEEDAVSCLNTLQLIVCCVAHMGTHKPTHTNTHTHGLQTLVNSAPATV